MNYKSVKTLLVTLTVFLTCVLVFSGGEKEPQAKEAPSKVVLTMMHWNVAGVDFYNHVADAFSKENPNISLSFDAKPFDQYFTVADTRIQAGEAPDVFVALGTASSYLSKWARSGVIEPLDDIIDVSGYLPWLVKDFMVDGKVYQSPPLVGDLYGVLYNKDLWDKYGLSTPKSQQDLINSFNKFQGNNIVPIMLQGKDINQDIIINMVAAYAPEWNNNFPWHKRRYSDLDDPEFVNALKVIVNWIDKGYFDKDFKSLDETAALVRYSQDKIAMSFGASYTAKGLQAAHPSTSVTFLRTPDGKNACIQTPSQGYGYCLSSTTKHRTEAIKLLKYLMRPEAVQEAVHELGCVPLSQPVSKDLDIRDPVTQLFASGDNPVPCWLDQISPITAEGFDCWDIFMTNNMKLFYKQNTPEEIAKSYDQMTDWSLVK